MIKEGAIGFGFSEACLPVLLTAAFSPRLHVVFPLGVRIPYLSVSPFIRTMVTLDSCLP